MGEQHLVLMGEFFDHVSETYDEVHSSHIDRAGEYYAALSEPIEATHLPIDVLDIGCGSGLELESLFLKAPNAQVLCIDLSRRLMDKLLCRYADKKITPHIESYLSYSYPRGQFSYIIASATLNHLLDDEKRELYPKLRQALTYSGITLQRLPKSDSTDIAHCSLRVLISRVGSTISMFQLQLKTR